MCNNDWAEKEQKEKDLIAAYVKDNGITEDQKTENGIYYIEEVCRNRPGSQSRDFVVINYTGRYTANNRFMKPVTIPFKDEWDNAETYKYFVYGPLKFEYGYSIAGTPSFHRTSAHLVSLQTNVPHWSLQVQQKLTPLAISQSSSIGREDAVRALCKTKLADALCVFLATQAGVKQVPCIVVDFL